MNTINKLDLETAYIKNNPIRTKEEMENKIKEVETNKSIMEINQIPEPTEEEINSLKKLNISDEDKQHFETNKFLNEILLSYGGKRALLYGVEIDLEDIIERGQLWLGDHSKSVRGYNCQCHHNSASLWDKHKDNPKKNIKVATGYALSDDGLWRQHSWCVLVRAKKNLILESTTERLAYFGFVLTDEESKIFLQKNPRYYG
jgi:hypothetical protein